MARTKAVLCTLDRCGPDWDALGPGPQWLYVHLLRMPRLTLVGSLDYLPARWLGTEGVTVEHLEGWAAHLEHRRFLLVDTATQELVIRTFTTHDLDPGRLSQPVVKGMWGQWSGIASTGLRRAVVAAMPDAVWSKAMPLAPPTALENRRSGPFEWEPQLPFECPVPCLLPPVGSVTSTTSPTGGVGGAEPGPGLVDQEQAVRKAARIVGQIEAARTPDVRNLDGYAAGVTKRLLTNPDDRARLVELLARHGTPEAAAEAYAAAPSWTDDVFAPKSEPVGSTPSGFYEALERRRQEGAPDEPLAEVLPIEDAQAAARAALRGRATGGAS